MRRIPRRSQAILDKLREDAHPKYHGSLKPAAEQRREAREALTLRTYVGMPLTIGRGLAESLRR